LSLSAKIWLFIVFGILGVFGEVVYTSLKSLIREKSFRLQGKSYLWMFPIYGLIALLFDPVHRLMRGWAWPLRGLGYMIVIYAVEYAAGALLQAVTGDHVWHYKGRYSLNGHIQLAHAPVWFAVGLIVERYFNFTLQLSQWLASR
jgi:uncharacterized membrane protein